MRLGGCHYNMSQNAFAFYENMHYSITAATAVLMRMLFKCIQNTYLTYKYCPNTVFQKNLNININNIF